MSLAVVLAALIMLAKASCWAFTMVSANSDQDLKTCFQASSTGAKASMPAETGGCSRREPCSVSPSRGLRSSRLSPNSRPPRLVAVSLAGVVAVLAGVVAIVVRLVPHGGQVLAAFGVVAELTVLAPLVLLVERARAVGVQRGRGRAVAAGRVAVDGWWWCAP